MHTNDNGIEDNAAHVDYSESDDECPSDNPESETDHYFTASNLPRGNPQFYSEPSGGHRWSMTVDWSLGTDEYEYIVMVHQDSNDKIFAAKDLFVVRDPSTMKNLCSSGVNTCE